MILRIFCDTLACHSERSPAEIPLGFASCFWAKHQKFDKLRLTPAGVRRGVVEIRPPWRIERDLSRSESRKKSVIYCDRAFSYCSAVFRTVFKILYTKAVCDRISENFQFWRIERENNKHHADNAQYYRCQPWKLTRSMSII